MEITIDKMNKIRIETGIRIKYIELSLNNLTKNNKLEGTIRKDEIVNKMLPNEDKNQRVKNSLKLPLYILQL